MLILITTNILETYSFIFIINISVSKVLQLLIFFTWGNSHCSGPGRLIFGVSRSRSVGSTPVEEGSARRRDLYLTTLKNLNNEA